MRSNSAGLCFDIPLVLHWNGKLVLAAKQRDARNCLVFVLTVNTAVVVEEKSDPRVKHCKEC
jgi:hypothetical protein